MVNIIQATPKDLPEILDIQKRVFEEVARFMGKNELPPLMQTVEDLQNELQNGIILKYFLDDSRIIGSVRGTLDKENVCHIGKLIVDSNFQNKGIGASLMYEIENYFPSCEKFTLFTGSETPNTVHLYKKLGYHITGEQDTKGITMLLMEKQNNPKKVHPRISAI